MTAPSKLTDAVKSIFTGTAPEISDDPYTEIHGDASLLCRSDLNPG